MKHIKLSLVFVIIVISVFSILSQKINALTAVTRLQIQYNNAIDNAVTDALYQVVDNELVDITSIDFATVTTSFIEYLGLNLGLEPSSPKGRTLGIYVPIIAYIVKDGVYFAYQKEDKGNASSNSDESSTTNISKDERNEFYKAWVTGEWAVHIEVSKRVPFEKRYGKYQVYYTLSDYVKVIDCDTNIILEGYYTDIIKQIHDVLPSTRQEFDQERCNVIVDCITSNMEQYIATHNTIAKRYGINYHFMLPKIKKEEWYRTIDDISMIALFQGYPYGNLSMGYYNRMALSGARVHKNLR